MSKTYTLPSISMAVGSVGTWTDADWHGYTKRADQSVMQVGFANNRICATNILFNPTMLASLRTKTIESIKLVLTVTWGTIQAQTSVAYPIGYKLNGEDGISANTGNNAWTRSNADSTAASTTVAVGYITSQSSSQISVGNTPVTLTYDLTGTKVPKYGYSLGNAFLLTSHLNLASSATLIVVTNETDYTLKLSYNANGGSGAPSAQTANVTVVGTPSYTFTIPNTQPTRAGYFFDGWKTSGGTTLYQPGGTITVTANTILYAQWSPASSIISSLTSSVPITGSSLTGTLTVNITRYNSSYTHNVTITVGSESTTLTGQGTQVNYVIPVGWLAEMPTTTSIVGTVEVVTKNGNETIGVTETATFTATVPDNVKPVVDLTYEDVNTNYQLNQWDVLVAGYSKIKLTVDATAGAGSEIESITFSGDGVSQSGTRDNVTSSLLVTTGTRTWKVVVVDKRNRKTEDTVTVEVYPYSNPVVELFGAFRSDSSGVESIEEGTYLTASAEYSISSVGGLNTVSVSKISYKLNTASSYTVGVASATSGQSYTFGNGGISLLSVYDVEFEIQDAVGNTTKRNIRVNSVVGIAFGLNNDRARFGGPVQKQGFQVDWNAEFNGVVDITNRRCFATLSQAGWHRVLTIRNSSGDLAYGVVIKFDIIQYGDGGRASSNHEISLSIASTGAVFHNETSNGTSTNVTKIRATRATGYQYVDIYVDDSVAHSIDVYFQPYLYQPYQERVTADYLQYVESEPSNETIMATYSFVENGIVPNQSIITAHGDLATTGTIVTDGNPSSVTVSTGTWTTISSITLTPGIWLVYATSRFASNATGYRRHILTGSDSDTSSNAIQMDDTRVAVDGAYTFTRSLNHYTLTGNKTYYLRAYQNSGTSLGTVGRLYATKII